MGTWIILKRLSEGQRCPLKQLSQGKSDMLISTDYLRLVLSFGIGAKPFLKSLLSTEHIPFWSVGTRKPLMKWMGPFKVVRKFNID